MRGDGGETKTVALHISSYELRATTDYADVLDVAHAQSLERRIERLH
jgi:hypothetical protein